MTKTIGILIFDDVEELDFCGPWEVFTMANEVAAKRGLERVHDVRLIGETLEPIRCAKGMRVLPDYTRQDCDKLDILLIPGGFGTRRLATDAMTLAWIAKVAASAEWVTSVCTGSLLLCAAGLAAGRKITTHWAHIEMLKERGQAAAVLEDYRYVRDGNVVTAAGVSAGIDMALWLTGQLHGPDLARQVQRAIQYDPAPPYAGLT